MNLRKKALSFLLAAAMIYNMGFTPALAVAAEVVTPIGTISICEHHSEHTTECGYSKGTVATACTHECAICSTENDKPAGNARQDKPSDSGQGNLQEQCSCKSICTDTLTNLDCPVCSVTGADLSLCAGAISTPSDAAKAVTNWQFVDPDGANLLVADEQFTLATGKTYYFDLSGEADNIGTINTAVPDATLHYVPFTYAGTVNAYSLDASSSGQTGASKAATPYSHSLFVADYNVSHSISWNDLNTANLIFGKTFDTNYKLRSLSAGSSSIDSPLGGSPTTNEWDSILTKNSAWIQNWKDIYTLGQDTDASQEVARCQRGCQFAAYWYITSVESNPTFLGFRPALEVLNTAALTPDGLKAVTLNLNGGTFNNASSINIVCAGDTFTAPSGEGLTRPSGNIDTYFKWNTQADGKGSEYEVGGSVPSTVTTLTAQWAFPQETKPSATLDYVNEKLTGLVASASYTITPNGGSVISKTANASGNLAIESAWFGKTLSIVKKGNNTNTADSDAQSLAIPARPAAPTTALQIAKTADAITIINASDYIGCEFSSDGSLWNPTGTFTGLSNATEYTISIRAKAVANSFVSESKTVSVTTIAADGSTALKPNESILTGDGAGTITNNGTTITIDKDKDQSTPNTVITPPSSGDITIGTDGKVDVPTGGMVDTGNGLTIALPDGGTADKDGNVSGGTNGSVTVGDTTITPPAGGTITTDQNGKTELTGGSAITNGGTTVTVGGSTSGGSVDKDGNISLPNGGEITVEDKDGNTTTIEIPSTGGDVGVKDDGTVTVPGGSTVTPPGSGTITVPEGGGTVSGDGKVNSNITVSAVRVTPIAASVEKGKTQQFTAAVTGTNNPAQTVSWTLDGYTGSASSISADGLLTVGSSETAAKLTVKATSTVDTTKSDMASVTITTSSGGGNTGGGGSTGGGSTDNDDSITVTPSKPTPENPNPPTDSEVKANGKVDGNGNATVTIPDKSVTNAIEKAQEAAQKAGTSNNGITVTMNVKLKQTANSLTAALSSVALDKLIAAGVKEFRIESNLIGFSFNLNALKAVQKNGTGDVVVKAIKQDNSKLTGAVKAAMGSRPAFDLSLIRSNKTITDFAGGAVSVFIREFF